MFWEIGQTEDGKKALLNPQSQNSYGYAGNNPVTYSDPDGRITGIPWMDIAIGVLMPNVAYSPAVGEEKQTNYALERNIMLMGFASPTGGINSAKNVIVNNADDAVRIISNETRVLTNQERQGVSNLIENSKLKNVFNGFFKASDSYPGGTAGAIKFTKETSIFIGKSDHIEKGQGFLNSLNKILNNPKVNQTDKSIAQTLSKQLKKVLKNGK